MKKNIQGEENISMLKVENLVVDNIQNSLNYFEFFLDSSTKSTIYELGGEEETEFYVPTSTLKRIDRLNVYYYDLNGK